jgi:epoxyqueuosine reductase
LPFEEARVSATEENAPAATQWTTDLAATLRAAAEHSGFHLFGIAPAECEPAEAAYLEDWIGSGRAGEMHYLKRRDIFGNLLRGSLQTAIPWARSVIVCALDYSSPDPLSIDPAPPATGWIGRYAWSGRSEPDAPDGTLIPTDYHAELLDRLRLIESRLIGVAYCQTRCYVDTGPILERNFAARAGIGWIGKNTCIINQELGSWLLLGVIVTSLELPAQAAPAFAVDRCGSCTRCIDACPTGALVAPREMDASRCIAYLTIEKKGAIDPDLREPMGRQVFGCDICQDVCPWNRKSRNQRIGNEPPTNGNLAEPTAVTSGMEVRPELVNPSLAWLAELEPPAFKRLFKGSPLERTGRRRLLRNVAIAMGNSGQPQFLPRLDSWAQGEDALLAEAARWAIEHIRTTHRPE